MKLKVPGEVASVAVGGTQYPVDKLGVVDVPAEDVDQLLDAGFTPFHPEPVEAVEQRQDFTPAPHEFPKKGKGK